MPLSTTAYGSRPPREHPALAASLAMAPGSTSLPEWGWWQGEHQRPAREPAGKVPWTPRERNEPWPPPVPAHEPEPAETAERRSKNAQDASCWILLGAGT
jgi:hypothetical protein